MLTIFSCNVFAQAIVWCTHPRSRAAVLSSSSLTLKHLWHWVTFDLACHTMSVFTQWKTTWRVNLWSYRSALLESNSLVRVQMFHFRILLLDRYCRKWQETLRKRLRHVAACTSCFIFMLIDASLVLLLFCFFLDQNLYSYLCLHQSVFLSHT